MNQVLQNVRTGELSVAEVPVPRLRSGGILVRNAASLISAGTERMVVDFARRSLVGKAQERPDLVRQVVHKIRRDGLGPTMRAVTARLDEPLALGYSCAGTVADVGDEAREFTAGDRVACAGMGFASHAEVVYVPRNLAVRIPDGVSFDDAAYVALGAIAIQGVRIADVRLGESVAVIGLGLVGLLSVQILRGAGCRVLGIDVDPARVALALELGAEAACVRTDDPVGAMHAMTAGVGADAVVITAATDSNDPVELAGELCRDRGRVAIVGAVRMDVPRKVFYEKELDLRLSRSYGPGRYDRDYEEGGVDYPVGYVRWTERRNMEEFLRLVAAGVVTPERLTTHRFRIDDAPRAYELVTGQREEPYIGIVLTYDQRTHTGTPVVTLRPRKARDGTVRVGVIGAGAFARSVLLPALAASENIELVGIATSSGASARAAGDRFGFAYATTDIRQVLDDDAIDAVVIATRHDSHASLTAAALRAGKAVFVEKPLAIDEAGLQEVIEAHTATGLPFAVGFNRRFSSLARKLADAFVPGTPLVIQYRINAGAIPSDHWIQDRGVGGGRVIGEVCHFVDFAQFLAGDEPVEVFASALGGPEGAQRDSLAITLGFAHGSVATITYVAVGDRALPKERIEVFGGGRAAVLDDFHQLETWRGGRRRRVRRHDKGHARQLQAFVRSVREGTQYPLSSASAITTTRVTFAIEESLGSGAAVRLDTGLPLI